MGHIVENDIAIHGLTVRMDQLEEENKNFKVVYSAKVNILSSDGTGGPGLFLTQPCVKSFVQGISAALRG